MALMPGASRVQKFSGNRHKATVDKIVIHTTEGSGWPGYSGGGNAPHFTTHRNGEIRQHIDTAFSAKALVNKSGGVETNNDGVIQIENIGSCDRPWARKHGIFFWPEADDDDLLPLARVLAWIHEEHGVPLTTRGLKFVDTNIAYANAPGRMTMQEWRDFTGIAGHQHVPENHHWDPGKMPVQRAIDLAKELIGATADVPAADPSRPWKTSPRVKGMDAATVRAVQAAVGVTQDGVYGDKTGTAVASIQAVLDLTADGVWGPITERTVMTIQEDLDWIKGRLDTKLSHVEERMREDIPDLVWGIGGGANAPMITRRLEGGKEYPETTLGSMTDRIIRQQLVPLRGEVAGLSKAIEQLAGGHGLDPDAIRKAVKDGMQDALDSLEVTVSKGD